MKFVSENKVFDSSLSPPRKVRRLFPGPIKFLIPLRGYIRKVKTKKMYFIYWSSFATNYFKSLALRPYLHQYVFVWMRSCLSSTFQRSKTHSLALKMLSREEQSENNSKRSPECGQRKRSLLITLTSLKRRAYWQK